MHQIHEIIIYSFEIQKARKSEVARWQWERHSCGVCGTLQSYTILGTIHKQLLTSHTPNPYFFFHHEEERENDIILERAHYL